MPTVSVRWVIPLWGYDDFYIKVKDNRLEDVKFQTFGCVAAIAVSSMVSEMAKGKELEEAKKITNKRWPKSWGACPPIACTAPI